MKKNKGITLVALVVTIVVLLILAGVSINLVLGNNGIIAKAKDAETKSAEARENDLKGMNSLIEQMESTLNGSGNGGKTEPETVPYLPSDDFHYDTSTSIDTGLVIKDANGNEYVWVVVPRTIAVYKTTGLGKTTFTDADYTSIENDLKEYTKTYRGSTSYSDTYTADDKNVGWFADATAYNNLKNSMLKSVYENGGFYIGRFEEGTANAKESTTKGTSAGPVSKINMYPYRSLTLPEAMDLTKKVNAGNRTCTLMYEVQWNLVLAHLHNKGNISDTVLTQNSDSIGNTSSVSFTLNRGKYYANYNRGWQAYNVDYYNEDDEYYLVKSKVKQKHAALLTTGAADRNKVMNIYDFAGNLTEWTIGVYSSTHWPCVVRGNSYNSGSNAANHGYYAWYEYDGNIGFRVSIY